MKEGNTTLSVPEEFANELRQDFDGRNDMERLKEWKGQDSNQEDNSYNKDITLSEIQSAVESALQENLADQVLGRY